MVSWTRLRIESFSYRPLRVFQNELIGTGNLDLQWRVSGGVTPGYWTRNRGDVQAVVPNSPMKTSLCLK